MPISIVPSAIEKPKFKGCMTGFLRLRESQSRPRKSTKGEPKKLRTNSQPRRSPCKINFESKCKEWLKSRGGRSKKCKGNSKMHPLSWLKRIISWTRSSKNSRKCMKGVHQDLRILKCWGTWMSKLFRKMLLSRSKRTIWSSINLSSSIENNLTTKCLEPTQVWLVDQWWAEMSMAQENHLNSQKLRKRIWTVPWMVCNKVKKCCLDKC